MEKKSIVERLDLLTKKLSELEEEIHQLVKKKYSNYYPCLEATENLCHNVHLISNEILELENKFKDESLLFSVNTELYNLNDQLIKSKSIFTGLKYLVQIQDLLQVAMDNISKEKFMDASITLNELDEYFKTKIGPLKDKITILNTLDIHFKVQKASFETIISEQWKNSVVWTSSSDSEFNLVTLSVARDKNVKDIVAALHDSHLLQKHMKIFSEKFQTVIMPLLLEESQLSIEFQAESMQNKLVLKTPSNKSKKGSETLDDEEQLYSSVFSNLILVLEHLNSMLLEVEYNSTNPLDQSSSRKTLMNLLSQEVAAWLVDTLKQIVLAKAIPSNAKDLEKFRVVIDATQYLEDKLLHLEFLQHDDQSLMNYVQNINTLFAKKKSEIILDRARELMMSNLFESVAVSDNRPMGELPTLSPGTVRKIAGENFLSDNTFKMPKCAISQNIDTLVLLAYETMSEATDNVECTIQMFYSVRNIFEMFCHVVPTHHAHSLETVPQFAALHHNNCMYITHHLMTMGHQFSHKLPHSHTVTFVDLIEQIRDIGKDVMVAQVKRQNDLLLEYLDGAEGFTGLETESNRDKAKKSVDQVSLQLEHLKKIWKPVLPINNYKKAMGHLIKSVTAKVIDSILSLEDISQEADQRLLEHLNAMEKVCGECLTSPGEVASVELARNCPVWPRFAELKIVLDSSLSVIADRWAEGKGPLASAFTPIELKKLIRALFQNTERRSNLLAMIK